MTKNYIIRILTIVILSFVLSPLLGQNTKSLGDDGIYYLKSGDGHEDYTLTTDEIIFKCSADGALPRSRDTGVAFTPRDGEIIEIIVEDIDLDGKSNYLLLYNGYVKTGYPQPASHFAKIGKDEKGAVYQSDSDDGKLSISLHSSYNVVGLAGWTIRVRSVVPTTMEYKSSAVFGNEITTHRGKQNQVLMGIKITTEGKKDPLNLTELKLSNAIAQTDVEGYKVYYTGSSATFSASNKIAEASTLSPDITIATDVKLKNGDNYLWFAVDISSSAKVDNTLPISLTSLKIGNSEKSPTVSAPSEAIKISSDILMQANNQTYTIDGETSFYDDGGIDGKIALNFEGSVTFVPKAVGKFIKIDFKKLAIFNTSSVGKNDVFKFYSGRAVDEANLITTLLKESEVVKSTAPDGSVTVYLKSTTGIAAEGWEAVVSEFTPSAMTYDQTSTEVTTERVATASDKDVLMLTFNVKTSNELNALKAQSFKFGADGTSNLTHLDKAKVYYLGRKNEFSTNKLFGEISVSANTFEVNGELNLSEGNNYFALVYDIDEKAVDEEVFAAALKNVKLSDGQHDVTSSVAERTISNVFYHQKGTNVKYIYDTWTFTDAKNPLYPKQYKAEAGDCIVTFEPKVEGTIIEMIFDKFDVYYSSSSYGVRAIFEIYSGTTTDQDNLLWKLDSSDKSKKGPMGKIRSKSTDGAITVKFNANTSTSSYTSTGWEASVRPFADRNMEVKEIKVYQENIKPINPNTQKQEIIGFSLYAEGTLTKAELQSINLDLKGSQNYVDKVSVLHSADKKDFAGAVEIGSIVPEAKEISIPLAQVLPEEYSYFWIAYDIKDNIDSNLEIDATLKSVKVDNKDITVEGGDPEGNRIVRYAIDLVSGENPQVKLSRDMLFYDDGGSENNYSKDFEGIITFHPSEEGQVVKMTFNEFKTATMDKLYVYSGTAVDEQKLIATLSGQSALNPNKFTASPADGGSMTLRFKSSAYGLGIDGWEAVMSSYTPQSLAVESVETSLVGGSEIIRGAVKEPIMQIALKVVGDKDDVKINDLKFNLSEETKLANVTATRLYYTGSSSGFIADNQFGKDAAIASPLFSTDEGMVIHKEGVYYFWVTFDILHTASPEQKVGLSFESLKANNITVSKSEAKSPAKKSIKAGMSGEYTIGKSSTANYSSFASAFDALKGGIEGEVKLKVESGIYNEDIFLPHIPGTSERSPIIITSQSGKNNDVIIKGKGYQAPPYGEPDYGLCTIEDTHHVTIENMSFIPTDQKYPHAIQIRKSSRYFTLRNSIVKANPVTSGYSGMSLVRTTAENIEGRNNDYLTIENSSFMGGYIALYIGGTGYVALTKEKGVVIRNNTITDAYAKGIYLSDEQDAMVEGNTVINNSTTKTGYQGMDLFRNTGSFVIRNNKIINRQTAFSYGLEIRDRTEGTGNNGGLVYNNSIAIAASKGASTKGILLGSDFKKDLKIYNNSVLIKGAGGSALGLEKSNTTLEDVEIKNNLFQVHTGSPIYFFNKKEQFENVAFANNAYHHTGSVFAGSSWAADIDEWRILSKETEAISEQADFFTDTDLHLRSAEKLKVALPLTQVAADIDRNTRNATTPTIGAYEYVDFTVQKPKMESGYPKAVSTTHNGIEVAVKLNQPGTLYYLIKGKADTPPEISELQAADKVELGLNEERALAFGKLTELTEYKVYFYMESIFALNSEIMTSNVIKTPVQIHPMFVTLPSSWNRIELGGQVEMTATVTGGVAPYEYIWRNSQNEIVGAEAALTVNPQKVSQYTLQVKDSNVEDKILRTTVHVNSSSHIATFDDNYLAEESYWQGYKDAEESKFYSGTYSFTNTYFPGLSTWGGFGYSNLTNTHFNPSKFLTDQFKSVTGKGVNGSNNYAIAYTYGMRTEIDIVNNLKGEIVAGVYLTNAAYTMNSIKIGDSTAGEPFGQGDWYKVTFTGISEDGTKTSIDCYLADYRDADVSKHYALSSWKWFDLSSLGQVTKIQAKVSGSRNNSMGLTTPAYFCMDNLGSEDPEKELFSMSVNGEAWGINNTYVLDCSSDNFVDVIIEPKAGYKVVVDGEAVDNGSFAITVDQPSIVKRDFTVKSTISDEEEAFTFSLEKYFAFDDIVAVMWNNTLLAKSNSTINGGYTFTDYRWFKNGELVSNKHFYSAGNSKSDLLDVNADYSLEVTTEEGDILHSCESRVTLKNNSMIVYPNPAVAGSTATVEIDVEEEVLKNGEFSLYNMQGVPVKRFQVKEKRSNINIPTTTGIYILHFSSGNFYREQKIIVK